MTSLDEAAGGTAAATMARVGTLSEKAAGTVLPVGITLGGRYLLQERLGHGGMGVVYKALDSYVAEGKVQGPPFVALKIVQTDKNLAESATLAIRQEGERLMSCRHDNIVSIASIQRDGDGTWFLVMELLVGEPLDAIIRRFKAGVPKDDALNLIKQLCSALTYLHEHRRIIHSDLKPSNVWVTPQKVLKLLDFGISDKLRDVGEAVTLLDVKQMGALSLAYSPLEMFNAEAPDYRDDVYSLGIVAFEILSGRHPFGGASARDRANSPSRFEKPHISSLTHGQNRALRHALALRRKDRSPTVDAFYTELTRRVDWYPYAIATFLLILGATGYVLKPWNSHVPQSPAQSASTQPLASSAATTAGPVALQWQCDGVPSNRTLKETIDYGLKKQFEYTSSQSGGEQILSDLRQVGDCLRKLRASGFDSKESHALLSDIDRYVAEASEPDH
jgi:serine/threonine protein kinase